MTDYKTIEFDRRFKKLKSTYRRLPFKEQPLQLERPKKLPNFDNWYFGDMNIETYDRRGLRTWTTPQAIDSWMPTMPEY